MSYVSQIAGVCTIVGTSTNLLVNGMARDLGHPGFSMFELTNLGVICFAAGCLYLLTVGRWLLSDARNVELVEHYELGKYITELRVMPESSVIGTSVGEAKLGEEFGVYVLELLRGNRKVWSPRFQVLRDQARDVLLVLISESGMAALRKDTNVIVLSEREPEKPRGWRAPFALATMALLISKGAPCRGPIEGSGALCGKL